MQKLVLVPVNVGLVSLTLLAVFLFSLSRIAPISSPPPYTLTFEDIKPVTIITPAISVPQTYAMPFPLELKTTALAATRAVSISENPLPLIPAAELSAPQIVHQSLPLYPADAIRAGLHGRVVLNLFLNADGRVGEIKVADSSGQPLLDNAAVKAAFSWTFSPAKRGGEAVESWFAVPVNFRLTS